MKLLKYKNFFNTILILSLTTLNLMSTFKVYEDTYSFLCIKNITIISFLFTIAIGIILFFKYNILEKIVNEKFCFSKIIDYILAIYLSIKSSLVLLKYFSYNESYLKNFIINIIDKMNFNYDIYWNFIKIILQFALLPILIVIWLSIIKFVIPKIITFFKSLNKTEKIYFIIFNVLCFIFVFLVTINTNVFNVAISHNTKNLQLYDVLFTSDSGTQILMNSYQNFGASENDLRQPLFAVFSFPFGLIASIFCEIFNYLPFNFMYSFFITLLQFICISVCSIYISRMINKNTSIYALIGYNLMFTTIFFGFNIEQYVFGVFWLLTLLYLIICHDKSSCLLFSAASGSLLTNVVLLPFIVKKKNIKEYIIEIIKYCFVFGSILIIFGQLHTILNNLLDFRYTYAMGSQVNITFINRLLQFISFIGNCFIAPRGVIDSQKYAHMSYQLQEVTSLNLFGLILIILMIISFILNRKNKIVKYSFGWLVFSFIILVIVGWGTVENGLIIYGFYFSWAYFILVYTLIDKIFCKTPKIKFIIFIILFLSLIIYNIFLSGGILDIIKFGKEYYPFYLQ